jgi:hypothetical protein
MNPFNTDKNIQDDSDFNAYVEDQFTAFLQEMQGNKALLRPITKDDDFWLPEGCTHVYTSKAMKMIDRYRTRIFAIGHAHFPGGDIRCESYLLLEE